MKDELEELAVDLGKNRPDVEDILRRAEVFPQQREKFIRLLKGLAAREERDWLNRRIFQEFSGEYPSPPESYSTHKLTVGTTGAGKSMSAFLEACALVEKGAKLLVLDYQNHFTDLGLIYPEKVGVAWPDRLKINLLERYGNESPEEVAGSLAARAREDFYFRDMSENIFFEEAVGVMKKHENATIYHLIKEISARLAKINVRERSHGAMVTILNRLNRVITELPHTFACSRGFPIEFFLDDKSVVFPLQGLQTYTSNFLVNHIISLVLRNKNPSDAAQIVFIIDECQNYINRQREARMDLGEVFIYSALRVSRKLNIGFFLLSQTMSSFSAAILSNTNSLFVGKLLNGQ